VAQYVLEVAVHKVADTHSEREIDDMDLVDVEHYYDFGHVVKTALATGLLR